MLNEKTNVQWATLLSWTPQQWCTTSGCFPNTLPAQNSVCSAYEDEWMQLQTQWITHSIVTCSEYWTKLETKQRFLRNAPTQLDPYVPALIYCLHGISMHTCILCNLRPTRFTVLKLLAGKHKHSLSHTYIGTHFSVCLLFSFSVRSLMWANNNHYILIANSAQKKQIYRY